MTYERWTDFSEKWHILVVGGDHHNALASLRSLGRAGVPFDLLLHSGMRSADGLVVASSRYCPKRFGFVDNSVEAISEGAGLRERTQGRASFLPAQTSPPTSLIASLPRKASSRIRFRAILVERRG